MTFTDSPDWQEVAVTVSAAGDSPDAPDWQRLQVAPGGQPVAGTSPFGPITVVSSTQTVDVSQYPGVEVNTSTSAVVLTLKPPPTVGGVCWIKVVSYSNTLTVQSETGLIDGQATWTNWSLNWGMLIVWDGSNWFLLSHPET